VRLENTAAAVMVGAALLTTAAPPAAAAALCPAAAGAVPALAAIEGGQRLAWIDARLSQTAHRARVWTWGWGTGIVVATLANLAPLPFVAPADRIDWYTGAATTIVGIVPLLIAPLDVIGDARALHQAVAAGTGGGDAQVCRLLADAEVRLVRDAQNQADGQRWWLHAGNVVLNVGVGLFLGLGYHHWWAGAFNAVGGSLIGEAIILTQPTASIDDLRRYRSATLDSGAPAKLSLAYALAF
jgi:hypothetical protein